MGVLVSLEFESVYVKANSSQDCGYGRRLCWCHGVLLCT